MIIDMQEPVALTFALRYLNSFAKATPLAAQVDRLDTLLVKLSCQYEPLAEPVHGFCSGGLPDWMLRWLQHGTVLPEGVA